MNIARLRKQLGLQKQGAIGSGAIESSYFYANRSLVCALESTHSFLTSLLMKLTANVQLFYQVDASGMYYFDSDIVTHYHSPPGVFQIFVQVIDMARPGEPRRERCQYAQLAAIQHLSWNPLLTGEAKSTVLEALGSLLNLSAHMLPEPEDFIEASPDCEE